MLEKAIESRLVKAAKGRGGWALKFVSPGSAGVPDRIVLLPGGRMGFVEVKAPGMRPRPLQMAVHRRLRELGFMVLILDGMEQVEGVLDAIQAS